MPDGITDIVTADDFRRGLQRRDAELVARALKAGVPIDTPVRGMHPLHLLLSSESEHNDKIIRLLFEQGLHFADDAAAPLQHVDHLLFGEDRANTVTVVLHAVAESLASGKVYQLRPEAIIAHHIALAGDDAAAEAIAALIAARLIALHGAVRERLLGGTDRLERQLMLQHYPKLGFWLEPFDIPEHRAPGLRGAFAEGAAAPDAAPQSQRHH